MMEPEKIFDCHAVAVMKNDLVGHIMRSIYQVVYCFLAKEVQVPIVKSLGHLV